MSGERGSERRHGARRRGCRRQRFYRAAGGGGTLASVTAPGAGSAFPLRGGQGALGRGSGACVPGGGGMSAAGRLPWLAPRALQERSGRWLVPDTSQGRDTVSIPPRSGAGGYHTCLRTASGIFASIMASTNPRPILCHYGFEQVDKEPRVQCSARGLVHRVNSLTAHPDSLGIDKLLIMLTRGN